MKSNNVKTNAMRILDSLSIEYEVRQYSWDEEHLDAVHAAESMGLDTERVNKTSAMKNNHNNHPLFCLPAYF